MTISRVKFGFVMIGLSIFLLLISGSLDDPETQMSVAGTAFLQNRSGVARIFAVM